MNISSKIKDFLNNEDVKYLINNGEFKAVFLQASAILYYAEMEEIFQLFQKAGIIINEKDLPGRFKIYHFAIGKHVKLDPNYLEVTIQEEEEAEDSSTEMLNFLKGLRNQTGIIIEDSEIDPTSFENSSWTVKFDNQSEVENIPGSVLIIIDK